MRVPDWQRTGLLVLLALVTLAPVTWDRELVPPDEPRFALVGREMAESGDYVVLSRGGRLYTDKPPLLFWGQALLFSLFASNDPFLARLPSLLATLVGVALLHRSGRRWFGEPLATRGTLVFASCALVIQRGAWVATDALLTAAVIASVDFLDRARDGSRAWSVAAGIALALATLSKGPVGPLIVLMAWAAGLMAPGAFSLRGVRWGHALAAFVLVAMPWPLLWVMQREPSTLAQVVWKQNVGRFVDSWDNLEPWWFHARGVFLGLLPWSIFAWPGLSRRVLGTLWSDLKVRWLAGWCVLALLFFTVPGSKRGVYLLPVYGALSLVVAHVLSEALTSRRARVLAGAAAALVALPVGAGALLAATAGSPPLPEALAGDDAVRRGGSALLALFAMACAWSAVAAWRASVKQVFVGPLLLALGSGLLAPPLLTPAINAGQGAEQFAREVRAELPEDATLLLARTKWELMSWYLEETLPWANSTDDLVAHLAAPGTRALLAADKDLPPRESWPPGTRLAWEGRLGRARVSLLLREAEPPPSRLSSDHERAEEG